MKTKFKLPLTHIEGHQIREGISGADHHKMNGNPSARQLSALANVCIWTLGFFGALNTAGWVGLERGQILRALRGVLTSHGQNLT